MMAQLLTAIEVRHPDGADLDPGIAGHART